MIKANAPKAHIISYGYTKAEYEEVGMRNGDTEKERNILPLFLCLKISCMNDVEQIIIIEKQILSRKQDREFVDYMLYQ